MTALVVREGPENGWAVHDCSYAPLLTNGRLVKKNDPAWQMAEKRLRDYYCLTERVRFRAAKPPNHKLWPGYELGFFHSHDSRREYPGYPDCHMWGDEGDLIRELKRMGEAPKPDQVATLTRMRKAGRDVGVWWPCCWYSGRIDRELAVIAGRPLLGRHEHRDLPPQYGQPGYVRFDPVAAAALATVTPIRAAKTAKAAPAADVLAGLLGGGATGYVIPAGALPNELAADMVVLRRWLRAAGIAPMETSWPIRIVVGPDQGVTVQTKTRPESRVGDVAWRAVHVTGETFPEHAAGRLATGLLAHSDLRTLMLQIRDHPGAIRPRQGVVT